MTSKTPEYKSEKRKDGATEVIVPTVKRDRRIKLPSYDEVPKVKGIFRNVEYPGTGISFSFRGGWKGPVRHYTLFDGLEYELPKEVADHLNNRCAYKTMKWIGADGNETVNAKPLTSASMPNFTPRIDKKIHRFMFQITG